MADYPLNFDKCEGIMASEIYQDKSYTKWVTGLPNATGPVLQYKKYILAHCAASSSPEPPASAGAGPSSPVPPATTGAALPSLAPSKADPTLLRKLDRL